MAISISGLCDSAVNCLCKISGSAVKAFQRHTDSCHVNTKCKCKWFSENAVIA